MASSGAGLKSGHHVLQMIKRFKRGFQMKALKAANNRVNPTMASCLAAIKLHIGIEPGGVYSLSWDGTRLSGMDVLFSTMFVHGKASWCPPIVPRWLANSLSGLCTFHTICMQMSVGFCTGSAMQICINVACMLQAFLGFHMTS